MANIVLVCGGRNYDNQATVDDFMLRLERRLGNYTVLCGGARGADSLALDFALTFDHHFVVVPADWNAHGTAAGPIRNTAMLRYNPCLVVGFPGGAGTRDMMKQARRGGFETLTAGA